MEVLKVIDKYLKTGLWPGPTETDNDLNVISVFPI
jgi:hypothetical protein